MGDVGGQGGHAEGYRGCWRGEDIAHADILDGRGRDEEIIGRVVVFEENAAEDCGEEGGGRMLG